MKYRIETVSSRIKRELFRIPPLDRQRIAEAVQTLADDPRPPGVKQLEIKKSLEIDYPRSKTTGYSANFILT